MVMKAKIRLQQFFQDNGLQKRWFANKIGISEPVMGIICYQDTPIPKKYWKKLIDHTQGYVTEDDLFEDFVRYTMSKLKMGTIRKAEGSNEWIVTIKPSSKKP